MGSSYYNKILDITYSMSLILIISILIDYMINTLCHSGVISIDTDLSEEGGIASLSTCYDILLVFSLSTCWESVGFTIEASSNTTSLLKLILLSFGSQIYNLSHLSWNPLTHLSLVLDSSYLPWHSNRSDKQIFEASYSLEQLFLSKLPKEFYLLLQTKTTY